MWSLPTLNRCGTLHHLALVVDIAIIGPKQLYLSSEEKGLLKTLAREEK